MKTVVAGIIVRDARVLICQRHRNGSYPFKWEFPGGKVEPGENLAAALARELREELGISAVIGPEIWRTTYHYPGKPEPLLVVFNLADVGAQIPKMDLQSFEQIAWVAPGDLPSYDFLPANSELIANLVSGALPIG